GPFFVQSWPVNGDMELGRNPSYWKAPLPYLDKVVLRAITDDTQRADSFMTGDANMAFVTAARNAERVTARHLAASTFQINLNGGLGIVFNTATAPFNDARARQAVTMAVDVK